MQRLQMLMEIINWALKLIRDIKDLTNAMETGYATCLYMPLTAQVMQMFQVLKADGCGQEDHGALIKYYQKLTGTDVAQ
ncbi:MAG: NAD-binding protein [Enterocloster sp.]